MIGKTISHYDIVEKLGQGGMGVVYKAQDTRLSRFVSIKMLSPEFASDENRRKRLLKEARSASSLNHPNICTIHEVDEADGALFVVMEFIQGRTLAQELSQGAMMLQTILDVAIQVAEALDHAHAQNIIHRDIKPSNILITTDGKVKVVDFGLARVLTQTDSDMMSVAATMDHSLTETGQIVGTVHFLSPEQIKGKKVDARSDIFSFGIVLYVMLTGRLPFPGKNVIEVISSILSDSPEPLADRDKKSSKDLNSILTRALAKNPEDRSSSMKELLLDLKRIQQEEYADKKQPEQLKMGQTESKKISSKGITIPPAIAEKKHVTVAVSHLSGYAELIEHLPQSEVDDLLQKIHDIADDTIQKHGGILNQFSGEEMEMIHGLPGAQEDDCIRAVRTVLDLHKQIIDLSTKVEDRIGQPLRLQSGITTGLVLSELLDERNLKYRITGNAVQLANRLVERAESDEILVSSECNRLIAPCFETAASDPIPSKGKTSAITPFRILGESGFQSRMEAAQIAGFTPFTGRTLEMKALHACLDSVLGGEGQFVTIVGDAGMGKSRLLYEFCNSLDQSSIRVVQGRCQSYGSSASYLPFIDALRNLLKVNENDPNSVPSKVVERIRAIDPSLESFISIYLHLLPMKMESYSLPKHLQGQDLQLAIREAFSAIFTMCSRAIPTVLILEDWHLADDASREVCKQLVEMIPNYSILIAAAYRPEFSFETTGLSNHTSVRLNPFQELLSISILKSVLNVDHFPEELGKMIHDRTGGNPFFLEEVCHTLLEEGTIRCADGKAILMGSLDQFRLPDTVDAVIRARLDRLNSEDREVLRLASVIGREFDRGILQLVEIESTSLLQSLENLKNLGLIQQIHVLPEATYKFKHVLIQEVVYESLLRHQSRELHDRVACVIEELHANRLQEHANVLAYHFSQAEHWEKAVRYGSQAAQQASKLGQFSEALQLYEKVHSWALKLPEDLRNELLIDALLSQERLCETLGKRERQQQLIDELRSIVEPRIDQTRIAEIYRRQADLNTLLHRFQAAEEVLQKSLEISRNLSDIAMERNALSSLGFLRWYQSEYEDGSKICERMISIDRQTGDLQNLAGDLTSHGNILRHLKEYERGLKCLEEALEIHEKNMNPAKLNATLIVLGNTYGDQKKMDKALYFFGRAFEVSSKHQLFIGQVFSLMASANIYRQQGTVEESLRLCKEALALSRKCRYAEGLAQSLRVLGEILFSIGKLDQALPYFLESSDVYAQLEDPESEAKMRLNAANVLEEGRRYSEALTNIRRVKELRKINQDHSGELETLEAIARISRLLGDDPLTCIQYYSEALSLAEKEGDQARVANLLNSIGILEWNREEYQKALEQYQKALKIFEDLKDQVHEGLMLNSIGVTFTRLDQLEEALTFLKRAVEVNRQTEEHILEGHSWAALGEVWYKKGNTEEALRCYETSLQIRRQIGDRKGEGWMLYHLSRLFSELGSTEESQEFLSLAGKIANECADQKLQNACSDATNHRAGGDHA